LNSVKQIHDQRIKNLWCLLSRLFEDAKEKKFSGIMWQVLEWNEPAINFYKKYNTDFDAEWMNCSISLKP